ncbi:hypothetical protein [Sphingomonas pokkalii]|uniref:hypothetical protein n=1 Tax=Sphingomonas pokkalii TaxID=2175090 RepID=UPI001057CDA9|nr:hypothetical protein [Sphingomonas pokkalii]
MSSDCALAKSNPFEIYQGESAVADIEALGLSAYYSAVSIVVEKGSVFNTLSLTFGKGGSFTGKIIPPNLAAGTYKGTAVFSASPSSYVGQQIIALATQVKGVNTINFATPNAVIGTVISAALEVDCCGGLFSASAS